MLRPWTAALCLLAASCVGTPEPPRPQPAERELIVFAASSLKEAFATLATTFEEEHPGVRVTLNLAGSQELRTQIEQGAPADVVALADERHMQALVSAGLVDASNIFARNQLCIAVPRGNPAGLHSLRDLAGAERTVVGAPEVPVGAYALRLLDNASVRYGADFRRRVEANIVSRDLNARQVLAKAVLGEADAAIVYETDVAATGGKVEVVAIPDELNVVASYPIAVVRTAPAASLARSCIALVLSRGGQARLSQAGFAPAPEGRAAN